MSEVFFGIPNEIAEVKRREGVMEILSVWNDTHDIEQTLHKSSEVQTKCKAFLNVYSSEIPFPIFLETTDLGRLVNQLSDDWLAQSKLAIHKERPDYPVPQEVLERRASNIRKKLLNLLEELSEEYGF